MVNHSLQNSPKLQAVRRANPLFQKPGYHITDGTYQIRIDHFGEADEDNDILFLPTAMPLNSIFSPAGLGGAGIEITRPTTPLPVMGIKLPRDNSRVMNWRATVDFCLLHSLTRRSLSPETASCPGLALVLSWRQPEEGNTGETESPCKSCSFNWMASLTPACCEFSGEG